MKVKGIIKKRKIVILIKVIAIEILSITTIVLKEVVSNS